MLGKRKLYIVAAILSLLLGAAVVHLDAGANSGGGAPIAGASVNGCTDGTAGGCHGPSPDVTTTYSIRFLDGEGKVLKDDEEKEIYGIPPVYEPDTGYMIEIMMAGGPPRVENPQYLGGFALSVTVGEFSAPRGWEDMVRVQGVVSAGSSSEITHTKKGSNRRNWTVMWTSPPAAKDDATFYLTVNAVDGNGSNDPGDGWNSFSFTVKGEGGDDEEGTDISGMGVPLKPYWLGVIGFFTTLAVVFVSFFVIKGSSRHHGGGRS